MTVTYPIIAPQNGDDVDQDWPTEITEAVNDHQDRISAIETIRPSDTDLTSRTTTSTTFTGVLSGSASIECAAVFVAPPSGQVLILWECEISSSGALFVLCSPAVRTGSTIGSGTDVLVASQDRTLRNGTTTVLRMSAFHTLAGLTPGATYNVVLEHQVQSTATGTFVRREICVWF